MYRWQRQTQILEKCNININIYILELRRVRMYANKNLYSSSSLWKIFQNLCWYLKLLSPIEVILAYHKVSHIHSGDIFSKNTICFGKHFSRYSSQEIIYDHVLIQVFCCVLTLHSFYLPLREQYNQFYNPLDFPWNQLSHSKLSASLQS